MLWLNEDAVLLCDHRMGVVGKKASQALPADPARGFRLLGLHPHWNGKRLLGYPYRTH